MSHENKRDLSIIACILIAIALFFALRYVYLSFSIDDQVTESSALEPCGAPATWEETNSEEIFEIKQKLDFNKKQRIGWRKYGFRRTMEIKEKTIIFQHIIENIGQENLFFGVYKDPNLKEPVAEVDMKYVLEAATATELGASEEDYPGHEPFHEIVLEPGTYYLAVYSTDPTEKQVVNYESRKATVDTDLALDEARWGLFFSTGKGQKTYFRIKPTKPGVLNIERDFWKVTYNIWLCNAKKEPISQATLIHPKKGRQKAQVTVPKAGTYYLQVSPDYEKPSYWPHEIRYTQE